MNIKCVDCGDLVYHKQDFSEEEQRGYRCANCERQQYWNRKMGADYWFKLRDSIYEVGKPSFSIVENDCDEHPDKNVIRISDCKFDVFIDISCGSDRQDALERATALCKVLNADYPWQVKEEA